MFNAASHAGVFFACAAGNSGPDESSVDNNWPWVTTVAAGTQPRFISATVALVGGGAGEWLGASLSDSPVGPLPLHYSDSAALCFNGTLDAAAARGKIVICKRGWTTRVEKSAEVARAGGAGMIVVNTADGEEDVVAEVCVRVVTTVVLCLM